MKMLPKISMFLAMLGLITFVACEKISDSVIESVSTNSVTKLRLPKSDINFLVSNVDGLLNFSDLNSFGNTLTGLSGDEISYYTPDVVSKWENSIGFRSLRLIEDGIQSEIDLCKSVEDIEIVKKKYSQYQFDENNNLIRKFDNYYLSSLTDSEGLLKINGILHCFFKNYQIISINSSKEDINMAKMTLKSNPDKGVFVNEITEAGDADRGACGSSQIRQCQDPNSDNNKKVVGEWLIDRYAGPVSNSSGVYTGWDWIVSHRIKMKNERKNWLGNWKPNYDGDDTEWKSIIVTNGAANVSQTHGWRQNSHTAQIDYGVILSSGFKSGASQPILTTNFTSIDTDVKNHDQTTCQCEDDCN